MLKEVVGLWLVTLLAISGVVAGVRAGAPDLLLAAVPILFMYAPVWWLRARGEDPDAYPLHLPAFSDRAAWAEAFRVAGVPILVLFVPFVLGYHLWQTEGLPLVARWLLETFPEWSRELGVGIPNIRYEGTWPRPGTFAMLVGYHLFFVAIPEELFYRGYMQSRLDAQFGTPWRILGADLGWGWLITCVLFALGHSLVQVQWWHLFIVFPSLIFGWMRARTGGIMAGALFHAWSNITVTTLDTLYGIVPP